MEYPLYRYPATSHAFLARAKDALARFDADESVDSFFIAAMHLRLGIEARLREYLDATLQSLGRNVIANDADYIATKLLKRLVAADQRAELDGGVRIVSEQTGSSTTLSFTAVSRELAAIHGRLGGYLHFSFFRNNPEWHIRTLSADGKLRTLRDHRTILQSAISELERATSGSLLSHPRFTQIVESIVSEETNNNGA